MLKYGDVKPVCPQSCTAHPPPPPPPQPCASCVGIGGVGGSGGGRVLQLSENCFAPVLLDCLLCECVMMDRTDEVLSPCQAVRPPCFVGCTGSIPLDSTQTHDADRRHILSPCPGFPQQTIRKFHLSVVSSCHPGYIGSPSKPQMSCFVRQSAFPLTVYFDGPSAICPTAEIAPSCLTSLRRGLQALISC